MSLDFYYIFMASAISSIGDGVLMTAAPLLAVRSTTNPIAIAGVKIASIIPWLMLGLISGVVADRTQRQRLMRLADLVRAFILMITAILTLSHLTALAAVYATVFLLGSGQTLFDSASQALIAQAIPADRYEKANGWLMSAETIGTTLLGPPIGSFLFAWHPMSPFVVDGTSFLISAALLFKIRLSAYPIRRTKPLAGSRIAELFAEVKHGLSWIGRNAFLRHMIVVIGFANFGTGMSYGIFVIYATKALHLSPRDYGFLLAIEAVGGLLGATLITIISRRVYAGVTLRVSMFAIAFTQLGLGFSYQAWFAAVMLFGNGFGLMVWGSVAVSERQRQIPIELRGRVASTFRLAGLSLQGVGVLIGGILAGSFAVRLPFAAGGVIVAIAAITPGAIWRARPTRV